MRTIRQRSLVAAVPITAPEPFDAQEFDAPGLSLAQVFSMLRAHLKLASIIVASIIALTALVTKFLPRTYTATATMIVNYQVSQGGTEIPSWLITTYMATQVELMRSPEVLLPVVDQLGLTLDPEFISGFRGGDSVALRNYVETVLDKQLDVEQGRGSQLLYVNASSRSPVKAAQIANAVADVYSRNERQRLKDPADDRARNYTAQLAELQAKVMAAQQKVTDLRQQTGTAPISTENSAPGADADTQTLISLEQQLLQAENTRRAAESATNIAPVGSGGAGATSPQIQQLNTEIVTKELQLSQLSATYGARHPKVLELKSDLNQARKNVKEEVRKYLNDARQIEDKLRRAVDAQRQKILAVRTVQDQGAKLQLELESTQSVYKRALDGYDQIVFASAGKSTNVSFVSRAAVPAEASKPNKVKFLLIGSVLAILFGIASPVLYEMLFDRRLHCRDDFERHFGVPVLAEFGAASIPSLAIPK
jgi:polysaccharide biosynthesis transport protein